MKEPPEHLSTIKLWVDIFLSFAMATVFLVAMAYWWFGRPNPPPVMAPPPEPEAASVASPTLREEFQEHTGFAPEAVEAAKPWADQQADFALVPKAAGAALAPRDSSTAVVKLWTVQKLVADPAPPNGPQLGNDCSGWACCHAAQDSLASQIFLTGGKFRRFCEVFSYAAGRETWRKAANGRISPIGCSAGFVMRSMVEIGVLPWDECVDPSGKPYKYSTQLCQQWEACGPPRHLLAIAAKYRVPDVRPVRTIEQFNDAVAGGYGVAWGSGFQPGNFREMDGRIVADMVGNRLMHCLCCRAIDGQSARGPWYHIQNSWPETAHPKPVDGSPAPGFWVAKSVIEYIVAYGDCYAVSGPAGFVDQSEDLKLFSRTEPANSERLVKKSSWPTLPASAPSKTELAP